MTTSPAALQLAREMLARQRTEHDGERSTEEVIRFCEQMRAVLVEVSGVSAFAALLQRALVLASQQSPALTSLSASNEGKLCGFDRLEPMSAEMSKQAQLLLLAELLNLLRVLIGEELTRRLAEETWPANAASHESEHDR